MVFFLFGLLIGNLVLDHILVDIIVALFQLFLVLLDFAVNIIDVAIYLLLDEIVLERVLGPYLEGV